MLTKSLSRRTYIFKDLRGKLVHEHDVSFPVPPVFKGETCLLTRCCPESAAYYSYRRSIAWIRIREHGAALSLKAMVRAREGRGGGPRLPSSLRQDAQCATLSDRLDRPTSAKIMN